MSKRRKFSTEFKAKVVLELISEAKSAAELCREHELRPDLLSYWKSQFLSNVAKVFESVKETDPNKNGSPNWNFWQVSKAWSLKF